MTEPSGDTFQADLQRLIPNLRAFARSLSRSPDRADDLVQEALIKAWQNRSTFAPGSNLKAWLFTILRNTYLSELRKRKFEVEDENDALASQLSVAGAQPGHMDLLDFAKAFDRLPAEQREALILVGAEGLAYEEVAQMCGCAIGTIKSRVNRARSKLAEMLSFDDDDAVIAPEARQNALLRSVSKSTVE